MYQQVQRDTLGGMAPQAGLPFGQQQVGRTASMPAEDQRGRRKAIGPAAAWPDMSCAMPRPVVGGLQGGNKEMWPPPSPSIFQASSSEKEPPLYFTAAATAPEPTPLAWGPAATEPRPSPAPSAPKSILKQPPERYASAASLPGLVDKASDVFIDQREQPEPPEASALHTAERAVQVDDERIPAIVAKFQALQRELSGANEAKAQQEELAAKCLEELEALRSELSSAREASSQQELEARPSRTQVRRGGTVATLSSACPDEFHSRTDSDFWARRSTVGTLPAVNDLPRPSESDTFARRGTVATVFCSTGPGDERRSAAGSDFAVADLAPAEPSSSSAESPRQARLRQLESELSEAEAALQRQLGRAAHLSEALACAQCWGAVDASVERELGDDGQECATSQREVVELRQELQELAAARPVAVAAAPVDFSALERQLAEHAELSTRQRTAIHRGVEELLARREAARSAAGSGVQEELQHARQASEDARSKEQQSGLAAALVSELQEAAGREELAALRRCLTEEASAATREREELRHGLAELLARSGADAELQEARRRELQVERENVQMQRAMLKLEGEEARVERAKEQAVRDAHALREELAEREREVERLRASAATVLPTPSFGPGAGFSPRSQAAAERQRAVQHQATQTDGGDVDAGSGGDKPLELQGRARRFTTRSNAGTDAEEPVEGGTEPGAASHHVQRRSGEEAPMQVVTSGMAARENPVARGAAPEFGVARGDAGGTGSPRERGSIGRGSTAAKTFAAAGWCARLSSRESRRLSQRAEAGSPSARLARSLSRPKGGMTDAARSRWTPRERFGRYSRILSCSPPRTTAGERHLRHNEYDRSRMWDPDHLRTVVVELFPKHDFTSSGRVSWRTGEVMSFLREFFQLHDCPEPKLPSAVYATIYNQVKIETGSTDLNGLDIDEMCIFAMRVHDFIFTGLSGEVREIKRKSTAASQAELETFGDDEDEASPSTRSEWH